MADPLELETEDITGVPILSAGGPYHGLGSPPEGDHITVEDLEGMAHAATELRGVVNAPLKLGHNDSQPILNASGLPAAGWLDNLRVNGTDLVADFRRVPKTVAALIRAGAYRARSVEFRPMAHGGNRYPKVVTGTALLGAELPAVKTLGDIVALYADSPAAESVREKGARAYITPAGGGYATPIAPMDTPWDPAAALERVQEWAGGDGEQLASGVRAAHLHWSEDGYRFPVADIIDGALVAVPAAIFAAAEAVESMAGDDLPAAELATVRATLSDLYQRMGRQPPWGQHSWPEAAGMYEAQPDGVSAPAMAADAPASVPDPTTEGRETPQAQENPMPDFNADLRGVLGLTADADEAAVLEAARAAKARQDEVAETATSYGDPTLSVASIITEATKGLVKADDLESRGYVTAETFEQVRAQAETATQRLYEMRRDATIDEAVRDGRLSAHQAEEWRGYFDAGPELVERQIAALPVREDLVREYGESTKPGADEATATAEDAAYKRAFGEGDA